MSLRFSLEVQMIKSTVVFALLVAIFSVPSFAQLLSMENLRSDRNPFLPPSLRDPQEQRARAITSPSFARLATFEATGPVDTAWVRYFQNRLLVPRQDHATQVVVDAKGNVIVTGLSQGSSTSWDFLTIKYSPAGDTLWLRRYITSGNGSPAHLAVDKSGNIYLAGTTVGSDTENPDYLTIKYNPAGDTVWVRRYNGPVNGYDHANAIAVDDSGNVYVTGGSASPGDPGSAYLTSDFATIKYNSIGDTVWTRRYDGPDHLGDEATGLVMDDSGNVYVAGISYSWTPSSAYVPILSAIIKYTSAGDLVWVSRYQTPGKNKDWPAGFAVDKGGNVYIGVNCLSYYDGLSNGIDFATVKYNSRGDSLWSRVYNGPGSISQDFLAGFAVDRDGNVYVTGNSRDYDYTYNFMVTIKYNSLGDSLWTRTYNAPGSQFDFAASLTLDQEDNAYVAGSSPNASSNWDYSLIKYTPLGDVAWVRSYNGPANGNDGPASLVLDEAGNVVITGTADFPPSPGTLYTFSTYATVKYSTAGDSLWARTYNSEPGILPAENRAFAFDIDGRGNAYVTGKASYVINRSDAVTVKFSPLGDTLWTKSPLGPVGDPNFPTVFKADQAGNIYVAVTSTGFLTMKYNSAGDSVWTRRFQGVAKGQDWPNALAVDNSDDVFVTGSSEVIWKAHGCATVKYSSAGESLWEKKYTKVPKSTEEGKAIAIDQNGNVYVAGFSYHPGSASYVPVDFLTMKYDSQGDTLWLRRHNASGGNRDEANLIAVDQTGDVYVAGSTNPDLDGSRTRSDYATVKYNPAGDTVWSRIYNGAANGIDIPTSLAVDLDGNAFITGYSQNANDSYDCATIKYTATGDTAWVKRSPQNGASPAFVAVDAYGNAYVTLSSGNADSNNLTTKYSPSGAEEWAARYPYLTNAVGIRLDKDGNVYVAGTGLKPEGPMYAVVKYVQGPTSVKPVVTPVPIAFALEQNYPNPFNPSTTIRYALPKRSQVILTVYNTLGQRVVGLVSGELEAGYHEVQFNATGLASGVYFYRLQAGDYTQTKKLCVIK